MFDPAKHLLDTQRSADTAGQLGGDQPVERAVRLGEPLQCASPGAKHAFREGDRAPEADQSMSRPRRRGDDVGRGLTLETEGGDQHRRPMQGMLPDQTVNHVPDRAAPPAKTRRAQSVEAAG